MINIVIDCLGAEKGIKVIIEASLKVAKNCKDIFYYFVGPNLQILKILGKKNTFKNFKIIDTNIKINQNDHFLAIKKKKNSSMIKAFDILNSNQAQGLISGGNSEVFFAACHLFVKKIEFIKRPAFMALIPTINAKSSVFLDVGANLYCNSEQLEQFAIMGHIYARYVLNIKNPKIGLLNIGDEEHKGQKYLVDTFNLLKNNKKINFYGNIEPRYIFNGICDVLVIDGFCGNLILKTFEGTGFNIFKLIKKSFTKNLFRKIIALFAKPIFKDVVKRFNYQKYNAALVVGLQKIVFKTHGSSNQTSYETVIEMAYLAIKRDIISKIKKNLTKIIHD